MTWGDVTKTSCRERSTGMGKLRDLELPLRSRGATTVNQLNELIAATQLSLDQAAIEQLNAASK